MPALKTVTNNLLFKVQLTYKETGVYSVRYGVVCCEYCQWMTIRKDLAISELVLSHERLNHVFCRCVYL